MLTGRRHLSTPTAMMIEAALDIPADALMKLKLKYNMNKAANDRSFMTRRANIRKMAVAAL